MPFVRSQKTVSPRRYFQGQRSKKTLDVWNIYKCEKCDYTWNIDIHARINTNKLDPELHQRFLHNDPDEVRRYAYNYSLLKRNHAELGPPPPYEIHGPSPYALTDTEQVTITLDFEQAIPVRLINILTRKLCLSRGQVARLIEEGVLLDLSLSDLNRKFKQSMTLRMSLVRLYQLDPPFVESTPNVDVF